jgi:hypothetical protein
MENETNIISDDEFLRELLGDVNPEETPTQELNELEQFLQTGETTDETPKPEGTDEEETDENGNQGGAPNTEEELEEKPSSKRFNVKDSVMTLIENGVWVDMPIKYGDKEYENIEELIDKEKPSKELFQLLSQAQNKHREEEIKSQYVKVGDKTSTKAKLVNAILHDVDYSDLLEYNKDVIEPLQKIDFTTIKNGDKIAEAFVKQCLVEIDGYHPDSIDIVVENLKKDFRLLEKAEDYQKITIDNFNREIEKRNVEKQEQIIQEKEQIKEDMKTLKTEIKNLDVDDAFATKILKLRYSKDDSGKFHYEQLIQDKIKDKAFEAKLMYFLLDDEDFIENRKSKVKTETQKRYLELVNITPTTTGGKKTAPSGNLQTDEDDLYRELGLLD